MSEELVPLKLLPTLERNRIINKWINGEEIQFYAPQYGVWVQTKVGNLNYNNCYRLPSIPAIVGPWELLESKWKWAAFEKNGSVWVYTEKPSKDAGMWKPATNMVPPVEYLHTFREVGDLLDIQVNTEDWEESLTKIR